MNKSITLIAQIHQCEEAAARTFCEAVQHCFKGGIPPFKLIAQHVVQSPQATALAIAQGISPNLQFQPTGGGKLFKRKHKQVGAGYDYRLDGHSAVPPAHGWGAARKNPLRSLDRLEPSKAAACPHGIPFYRKCGICHKKEFEEATGLG
jgi:hypothetical protein